ncbi:ent-kaurenoic acid oxidase-like [Fagus crenata]
MYWNVFQEDGIWLATKILTHPSLDSSDAAAHHLGPTTTPQLPSHRDESFRPRTKLSRRSSASIDPEGTRSRLGRSRSRSSSSFLIFFEPGPHLDYMDKLFTGLVHGIRAYPVNFPGTTYHHALQRRRIRRRSKMERKYESTSLVSLWAIYYLAKFPNVLEKLREENMAVTKNKKGDFITSEDVSKMKYTNKVSIQLQ